MGSHALTAKMTDKLPNKRPPASQVEAWLQGATLLEEDGFGPKVYALADGERIQQVVTNIVHNAIKFTLPGGRIDVTGQVSDQEVVFTVRDTGVGIPEDDLPRIFERFFKSDRARSGGGTGLGLSIARHIVLAHGGRIWAESVEGEGATFHFTLLRANGHSHDEA